MPKMYYCHKCKKRHRCGKIYEEHKKYIEEEDENVPCHSILDYDPGSMRAIAMRQINIYLRKMTSNGLTKKAYIQQINKIILYEEKNA